MKRFYQPREGTLFKEKARSSSFGGPSSSKVSFCVSLPATADSKTCPQLCLHLGRRAQEPRLREGGPGGQVEERMAGAAVQQRLKFRHVSASKGDKFPRHRFECEAPVRRGPGSQLPPSRPPPKMGAPEQATLANPPTRTFPDSGTSTGNAATVYTHSSSSLGRPGGPRAQRPLPDAQGQGTRPRPRGARALGVQPPRALGVLARLGERVRDSSPGTGVSGTHLSPGCSLWKKERTW